MATGEAVKEAKSGKEAKRGRPKFRDGVVVSDKAAKTIIVAVVRRFQHAQYGKFVSKTKKYAVHDAKDEAREGDTVRITECKPMSKTKTWRLAKVLARAEQ